MRSGAVSAVAPEFPAILHGDVAGIVIEVEKVFSKFKSGDKVYGCAGGFKETGGALAEFMLADARLIAHKTNNLQWKKSLLPLVAITAWESLFDRANIKPGQNVLIHGATGGVGHVAIQLAKWAGAKSFHNSFSAK